MEQENTEIKVHELQKKLEIEEESLQDVSKLLTQIESDKEIEVAKHQNDIQKLEGDLEQVNQKLKQVQNQELSEEAMGMYQQLSQFQE